MRYRIVSYRKNEVLIKLSLMRKCRKDSEVSGRHVRKEGSRKKWNGQQLDLTVEHKEQPNLKGAGEY